MYLFSDPTLFYTINYGTLTRHIICSRSVSWLRRSTWFWHKKKNATKKEAKSMHTVRFSETIISDGVGRLTTSLVMWSCIFFTLWLQKKTKNFYLQARLRFRKCYDNSDCCLWKSDHLRYSSIHYFALLEGLFESRKYNSTEFVII